MASRGRVYGMTRYAAIDTGTTRNATVLAIVDSRSMTPAEVARRPTELTEPRLWAVIALRRWQGRPGSPLDIRHVVAPVAARIVREHGIDSWATDGIELAAIQHVSADPAFNLAVTVQGGELGPDETATSLRGRLGVYGHARVVIHEMRLVVNLDDEELATSLLRGIASIQAEPKPGGLRLWLPSERDAHADEASAVLRALWHAGAGLPAVVETEPVCGAWSGGAVASSWDERFPDGL